MSLDNILVWADPHFSHRNVMKFCPKTRPWATDPLNPTDAETLVMDEALIEAWNKRAKGKTIYCIGDFTFSRDDEYNERIFNQLMGDKHLIKGNHDHRNTRNLNWSSISDYKEITVDKQIFVMFHYPISSWNKMLHGSIHIYGHVHGAHVPGKDTMRMFEPSVDNGFSEPVSLREVVEHVKHRVPVNPPIW